MANTEPNITLPGEPITNGDVTDFEVCGNPDIKERVHVQSEEDGVQVALYGYVDATTNTVIHSHEMTFKKGVSML